MKNIFKNQCATLLNWRAVIFMAVPCLWFAGTTYAQQTWQTEAEMRVVATDFLHQQFGDDYKLNLKFGNLDDRLRLDKCQQPLRAFLPSNRAPLGAVSLGIRCTQPVWKIHLPVKVRAYTNVLVASRPIVKNSIIKRQDLQFVHQDISRYYAGVFTNPKDLVGMVAKRSIRHDAVITGRMVEPKRLVKRGDMVTIIAKTGSLQIRTKGEALSDGHQGQVIQVKNHRSGRQVSAEVIAQSTVRVKL